MGAASTFGQILEVARPQAQPDCPPADAAAIVAAVSLMILGDEVVTVSERATLPSAVEEHFGVRIQGALAKATLERVAGLSRNLVLHDIAAHCRGWPRERIAKLMRCLWAVAGDDQNVAWGELAILKRLGALLEWTDERLASATVSRRDAPILARIHLHEGDVLHVGRTLDAEICLHRAPIASRELRLAFRSGLLSFETLVGDVAVTRAGRPVGSGELAPGETLSVGRYQLRLGGKSDLLVVYPGFQTRLEVHELSAAVGRGPSARTIVSGVEFQVNAGEMLAVIGPSGCGKSTLLSVLRGDLPPSRGRVTLDGLEVRPGQNAVVRRISLVPQEELLLNSLTVEETVTYAARLKGIGRAKAMGVMAGLVDEILERVGLAAPGLRDSAVGDAVKRGISGGQRRRVSVAQELVGDDTDVLLLDEPTSGLDPRSEAGILALMRSLADSGHVVVAATHAIQPHALGVFDRLLCLDARGRVEYMGPPAGLFSRFGTSSTAEIFERLEANEAASEAGSDAASIDGRAPRPPHEDALGALAETAPPAQGLGLPAQIAVLVRRELQMRARDRTSLVLALALPVAVAGLCSVVYQRDCVQPTLLFVLCLTSVWTGVSFTVRDLISNFAVLRHESRTRASLTAAYGAKALVATSAAAVQAGVLTAAIFLLFHASSAAAFAGWPLNILEHTSVVRPGAAFGVLWACHAFGNALGMVLSASFRTAAAAIFMIPFAILPMVTFSGTLVPPRDLRGPWRALMNATPLYQGYIGMLASTASVCSSLPFQINDPTSSDRASFCGEGYRTVHPAPGDARPPFVQTEASCEHNVYQRTNEFCRQMQLCPPEPEDPFAGRLEVKGHVLMLLAITGALHVAALRLVRRRIRGL